MQSLGKEVTIPNRKLSAEERAFSKAIEFKYVTSSKVVHSDSHIKEVEKELIILGRLHNKLNDMKCDLLSRPSLIRINTYKTERVDDQRTKAIKELLDKRIAIVTEIYELHRLKHLIETHTAKQAIREIMLHKVKVPADKAKDEIQWILAHSWGAENYAHPHLTVALMVAKLFPKDDAFKWLCVTIEDLIAGNIANAELTSLTETMQRLELGFTRKDFRKTLFENFDKAIRELEARHGILKRISSGYLPIPVEGHSPKKDKTLTGLVLTEAHLHNRELLLGAIGHNVNELYLKDRDSKLPEQYRLAMTRHVEKIPAPSFEACPTPTFLQPSVGNPGLSGEISYKHTLSEINKLFKATQIIEDIRSHYSAYKATTLKETVSKDKAVLLNDLEKLYSVWLGKLGEWYSVSPILKKQHSADEILEMHILPMLTAVDTAGTNDHFQREFHRAVLAMKALLPPKAAVKMVTSNNF